MLNALVPKFIKRIDKYFLLNHPLLWISKVHYVLYYAIIMWLLSALIGFVVPINLSQPQDIGLWYVLFTVLAIVLFCVWIYRNAIFNVEKKFGNRHWTDEFKLFLLYFLCIFIFFSFAYPFAITYNTRIAHTVTDAEFIEDINTLNRAEPFIPRQLYNYYNYYDSTKKVTFYDINRRVEFGGFTPYTIGQDTIKYGALKSNYELQTDYEHDKLSDHAILKALEERNRVSEKYGLGADISPAEVLKTYRFLCKQWQHDGESHAWVDGGDDYNITRVFDNVAEAKFRTIFLLRADFLWFVFYFTLYLTMFFLLFRNNRWQHFLITVVTLIILPILLFIIGQIIPYDSSFFSRDIVFDTGAITVFGLGLIFTVVFMIGGKRFSSFRNICMQLFYLLFPVMPMYITYYLKRHTGLFQSWRDYNPYALAAEMEEALNTINGEASHSEVFYRSKEYYLNQYLGEYWQHQYDLWYMGTLIAGIVVFIFVIMPLMKELFVKQLALPRQR